MHFNQELTFSCFIDLNQQKTEPVRIQYIHFTTYFSYTLTQKSPRRLLSTKKLRGQNIVK